MPSYHGSTKTENIDGYLSLLDFCSRVRHCINAGYSLRNKNLFVFLFLDRQLTKEAGGLRTQYCYDGEQVIAEYENGTLKRKFIYSPGIDEPIIMIDDELSREYI